MPSALVSRSPLIRRVERHSRFATLFRHVADEAQPIYLRVPDAEKALTR